MQNRKKISGIYMIINVVTKEMYIGSSMNCINRFYDHKKVLRKNKHHSIKLQESFNEYGESNFSFEIIEEHENVDRNFLYERENFYFNLNKDDLFNTAPCAESIKGLKRNEEFIKALSKRAIKTFKGIPKSAEHKEKIRAALKGRKLTEEQKKFISIKTKEGMKANNSSEKISKALKGKKQDINLVEKRTKNRMKKDIEKYKNKILELQKLVSDLEKYN